MHGYDGPRLIRPTTLTPRFIRHGRVERVIAIARRPGVDVLFAIWLDPAEPQRRISLT